MNVEEAEDLRLGIAEGVPDGAGLERGVFWQLDDELHSQGPLAAGVTGGQAEFIVECLADSTDRAVANDGERRADIHSGHEGIGRRSGFFHPLIGEAKAPNFIASEERSARWASGPDLHEASGHQLRADPLVELAYGEYQAAVLVEKRRRPGEGKGIISDADELSAKTQEKIAEPQKSGAAAGPDGVEQVHHPLAFDLDGHGNFGRVEVRETGANRLTGRDHAADAGADVVGAFVAENLQRHSRRDAALEGRIGGILGPCLGERGKKAAHRGTKTDAGDVHFHGGTVDRDGLCCFFFCAQASLLNCL